MFIDPYLHLSRKAAKMATFTIIDKSLLSDAAYGGALTTPTLEQIAAALEQQANVHVAPEWGGSYIVRVAAVAEQGEIPCYILDALPQAPEAAALHDVHGGVPIVFAARNAFTSFLVGERSLSEGLSHEVCETIGDPSASIWSDRGDGSSEALELCDRLQGSTYDVDGVTVANFLHRSAFFNFAQGPYDYLSVLQGQQDKTPQGYVILRDVGGNERHAEKLGFFKYPEGHSVFAEGVIEEHHLAKKGHFTSRSYRRGLRL
jgi:hypothetical protein